MIVETRAFYFGREAGLFGIVDEPVPDKRRGCGVLICQPVGHEYVRCHRGCRQLAQRTAMAGFPTLRFDYAGCGDSAGETHECGPDEWEASIGEAMTELRRSCQRVCVVGVRLGGALACGALDRVDALVLWQPVTDGAVYLNEMDAQHQEHAASHGWSPGEAERAGAPPGTREQLGFAYSRTALEAIAAIGGPLPEAPRKLAILNTEESGVDESFEVRRVGEPGFWNTDPYEMVIPSASIDAIVAWIGEACS